MRISGIFISITLSALIIIAGCSSSNDVTITQPSSDYPMAYDLPVSGDSESSRTLLGIWSSEFDMTDKSVRIDSAARSIAHKNVTQHIPAPTIQINSYNPATKVIDVDVTLVNPTQSDVYDVRLIIYTDDTNTLLLNPDAWTSLYNIPQGMIINPFKAYAKDQPSRVFASQAQHTENLLIHLPKGNMYVMFAVDASLSGNCKEPYAIENFSQDALYSHPGSSANVRVDVLDWQDDVSNVYLHCPVITGETLTPFTHFESTTWELQLENVFGRLSGNYNGWIVARSSNSGELALYNAVTIAITHGHPAPDNPQIAGYLKTAPIHGRVLRVITEGDYAYIGAFDDWYQNGRSSLNVIDIRNPLNPVVVDGIEFPGQVLDIRKYGDYIFIAKVMHTYVGEMIIVDASNPLNLQARGTVDFHGVPLSITADGDLVYLSGQFVTMIYDISDADNPEYISEFSYGGTDIEIQGNYAFAVSRGSPFRIWDISDPMNVTLIASIPAFMSEAHYLAVDGDYVYTSGEKGFKIIDISDITQPEIIAELSFFGSSHGVVVYGDYAYVAGTNVGLRIIDISDRSNPVIMGATNDLTYSVHIDIAENFAYIATFYYGFQVYDISDLTDPAYVTTAEYFAPQNIKIYKGYAIMPNHDGTCLIVDISDPVTPEIFDIFYVGEVDEFRFQGDYGYFIGDSRLIIMNMSDLMNPVETGSVTLTDRLSDLDLTENYAYIVADSHGMTIVDISDPSDPFIAGTYQQGVLRGIIVDGSYAYVIDWLVGLRALDISDPENMSETGRYEVSWISNIEKVGNYIYARSGSTDIRIIDVSDPENLQYIRMYVTSESFRGMINVGKYVYLESDPLLIFDITNPERPWVLSSLEADFESQAMDISGNMAYVTHPDKGMMIIQLW